MVKRNNYPIRKLRRQAVHWRGYTSSRWVQEKMLETINHGGDANWHCNEISLHTYQHGCGEDICCDSLEWGPGRKIARMSTLRMVRAVHLDKPASHFLWACPGRAEPGTAGTGKVPETKRHFSWIVRQEALEACSLCEKHNKTGLLQCDWFHASCISLLFFPYCLDKFFLPVYVSGVGD